MVSCATLRSGGLSGSVAAEFVRRLRGVASRRRDGVPSPTRTHGASCDSSETGSRASSCGSIPAGYGQSAPDPNDQRDLEGRRGTSEGVRLSNSSRKTPVRSPGTRPPASSALVRRRMRNVRRRDTPAEIALRQELHRRGLRYRVDARPLKDMPRKADVVFRRSRVAVFVDGCFWHHCPVHGHVPKTNSEWWAAKLKETQRRDADTVANLERAGWTVIRMWEHEDPRQVAERIHRLVKSRTF